MPPGCKIPNLVGNSIDHGRFKFTSILGSGSSGVIFLAQDMTTGSPPVEYAVKCMVRAEWDTRWYDLQLQEIEFHKMLSGHPNVVTLHHVIETKHYLFLIMDYCRGGDFFTFLTQRRDYRGDDRFVRRMFLQMVDALQACHDAGVYHRDIKPENLLLSEDGTRLYLADFGMATPNPRSVSYGAGSYLYMSPECIAKERPALPYDTRANDIWALGIILTSMVSGHNPWHKAIVTDPCYQSFCEDPGFLRKMLPITESVNVLLQQIFAREHQGRISLPAIRKAVSTMDTFFMSPDEIINSSEYVRTAAQSYYSGSGREGYYIVWSSPSSQNANEEDDHVNAIDGLEEAHDGDESAEGSPASTVDTYGPSTPDLRAQHLEDVPADDSPALYLARSLWGAKTTPRTSKMQPVPNFLRRIVDRFHTERRTNDRSYCVQ